MLGAGLGKHRAALCIPLPGASSCQPLSSCFAPSSIKPPSPASLVFTTGHTESQPAVWLSVCLAPCGWAGVSSLAGWGRVAWPCRTRSGSHPAQDACCQETPRFCLTTQQCRKLSNVVPVALCLVLYIQLSTFPSGAGWLVLVWYMMTPRSKETPAQAIRKSRTCSCF